MSTDTMGLMATHAHELVADEVRAELARRRISGRELARRTGEKPDYWARRIAGRVPFDVNDLVTVAYYLDVPVTDLLRSVTPASIGVNPRFPVRPGGLSRVAGWELAA